MARKKAGISKKKKRGIERKKCTGQGCLTLYTVKGKA